MYNPTASVAKMADPQAIARQFVEFYYSAFDKDRSQLSSLYSGDSMLTFEDSQFQGSVSIIEKLVGLPFQKVVHSITTLDAQPLPNNGISILVTGELMVDDSPLPMRFSQLFNLLPTGSSYYVLNDIFRLNYG
ncbi:Nuclear transport factor 2 [Serendipita sp. 396]|nr:Nuclear transport factor 2 [Serendipita sp. 396]KAG8822601.1 Nuclear transport factor 2 [Serendipita sp. 401]KAG9055474.1 Nuclear transport factor 2 [Serendipita sp. 407]